MWKRKCRLTNSPRPTISPRRNDGNQRRAGLASAALFLSCTAFSPAFATEPLQVQQPVTLTGEIKAQGVDLHNGDLGTTDGSNAGSASLEGRFFLTANLAPNDLFIAEARGVASAGHGGFESADTGAISNGKSFLELRQAYFEFDNLGGDPLGARLGRQRYREPYGLWWNRDFDSVRFLYDTTLVKANIAAGQNLSSYQTGPDTFKRDERDIARVFGEASYQYFYENFIEARMMYADDHSGVDVGDFEPSNDLDTGTGNLVWMGLRAVGKSHIIENDVSKLLYRADLMFVTGHEDVVTTAPLGSGQSVTAMDGAHVNGWAFDAATDVPVPGTKSLVHLGYAYGSGDSDTTDGTDHGFRQTGLEGNFSRIGALSENTDNYGTVLRPQLSNIHIFSAGVTMPVLDASNVGVIYRYYRLADAATSLPTTGIENTLNGVDKDLGQGLDLLFNMDLLKEEKMTPSRGIQYVSLRSSLGFFRAGSAYGPGDGDVATRGLVEVKVGF